MQKRQRTLGYYLSDILVSISKAEQEVRQHMDHIWLKQLPQHVTQHLKGKQRSWTETNNWSVVSIFFYPQKYLVVGFWYSCGRDNEDNVV